MRRGGLRAEVDVGGGSQLRVIGVHFHNQRVLDLPADELRTVQAEALVAFWNREDRTVVMGDLNSVPDSGALAVLKEAGLRDAFELGGGERPGLTFLEFGRPVRRIDYILLSPDLTAREFRTFPEALSDHLGIAATLSP
jgi:endonuclease/exonuclease/phosphatase family metal-dependent hydrolase